MIDAAKKLGLSVQRLDDLKYAWTLHRREGEVIGEGVEAFLASGLAAATATVDPAIPICVTVDDVDGGEFSAARLQLDSSAVALEIAQAMLTQAR